MLEKGSLEENEVSDWNEYIECLANPDKRNRSILKKMQAFLKKAEKKLSICWGNKSTKTNEKLEKKIKKLKESVEIMNDTIMEAQKFINKNTNIPEKHRWFDHRFKNDFMLKIDEMKILNRLRWNVCINALANHENNSIVIYLQTITPPFSGHF